MRILKNITSITLVLFTAVSLYRINGSRTEVTPISENLDELVEVSNRSPASKKAVGMLETFEFSRHIKATLHHQKGDKKFADLSYQGLFTVEWKDPSTAYLSFQLDNGTRSEVDFELGLDHWELSKIRVGNIKNEQDEDTLNILKDFASIFAYRSKQDTAGKYSASMTESAPTKNQILITKRKNEYETDSKRSIKINFSKHEIIINPVSHKLISAEGKDTTTVEVASTSSLLTTSEYKICSKGTPSPVMSQIKSIDLKEIDLKLISHAKASVMEWPKMIDSLNSIQYLSQNDRLNLFHELVKTINHDPNHLKDFLDWVSINAGGTGVRTFAIGVLATQGSEESQKNLLKWFQNFPESRPVILNAFTTSNVPFTKETKIFLSSLIDQKQNDSDSAYAAAFALGTGIKNSSASGNVEPNPDINKLLNLFNSATNAEEQGIALSAMGNSGNQVFIPTIEKNIEAADENLREKAVLALRLMPVNHTLGLVNQAWNDPSIKVKSAAIQVINFQGEIDVYQGVLHQCVQSTPALKDACLRVIQQNQHS